MVCFIQRCSFVGVLGVGVDKAKSALRIVPVDMHTVFRDFEFAVAVPAAGPLVFLCGIAPFTLRLEEPAGRIVCPAWLFVVRFRNKDAMQVGQIAQILLLDPNGHYTVECPFSAHAHRAVLYLPEAGVAAAITFVAGRGVKGNVVRCGAVLPPSVTTLVIGI